MDKKILVILGPTATGKTALAVRLAKQFNGELIACDSRQVYNGLDIGTGKDNVKAYLYDIADPRSQYSVYDYVKDATWVVNELLSQNKLPIIVGGTGLYLKALLRGLPNLSNPVDQKLRGELEKLSLEQLQKKLRGLSPTSWKKLNDSDRKNPRRLLRLIEIHTNPYMERNTNKDLRFKIWQVLKIGLTAPREVLKQKIDSRLNSRISQGLIEEGEMLLKNGLSLERMKQLGLEYGVLAQLLNGEITKEQFTPLLKTKIHQYAKRQMTWFKKYENDAKWFDITDKNFKAQIEKLVQSWYYQANGKTD